MKPEFVEYIPSHYSVRVDNLSKIEDLLAEILVELQKFNEMARKSSEGQS